MPRPLLTCRSHICTCTCALRDTRAQDRCGSVFVLQRGCYTQSRAAHAAACLRGVCMTHATGLSQAARRFAVRGRACSHGAVPKAGRLLQPHVRDTRKGHGLTTAWCARTCRHAAVPGSGRLLVPRLPDPRLADLFDSVAPLQTRCRTRSRAARSTTSPRSTTRTTCSSRPRRGTSRRRTSTRRGAPLPLCPPFCPRCALLPRCCYQAAPRACRDGASLPAAARARSLTLSAGGVSMELHVRRCS
jgi:hypothetical protein